MSAVKCLGLHPRKALQPLQRVLVSLPQHRLCSRSRSPCLALGVLLPAGQLYAQGAAGELPAPCGAGPGSGASLGCCRSTSWDLSPLLFTRSGSQAGGGDSADRPGRSCQDLVVVRCLTEWRCWDWSSSGHAWEQDSSLWRLRHKSGCSGQVQALPGLGSS